ncbi:MAG: AAA family ATPase [Terracidiphilus sp.]
MKTLRIFISSPSDVRSERVRAYDVVQRLQAKFQAHIRIESILWEDEPMRATSSFQPQIARPSESDVVVCVLWARIGTRLPQEFKRADGTIPTGTEWEFEDALESYKKRGTPDLLVYRKLAQSQIMADNVETVKEWVSQKEALDAFLDKWFRDNEGAFKAAFNTFNSDEEFEKLLTTHLEKIISQRLDKQEPITWPQGSPYRGLDIFQLDHKAIFFGRDLAIAEITSRLLAQASRGRAFLIVLGMSGCGKSSLVRAGVLAELMRPGVVENVGCWRWAIMRPSEASGTLTEFLASVLYSEKDALPELSGLGYDVQQFAAFLQDAPTHAIPLVEAALARAARRFAQETLRSKPPEARLILVIDQLEEMFTVERFNAPQRTAFINAISALSRSGLAWVITTMRSDLYARCAEIDELRALKSDNGQYDLMPPSVAEIGQIIRMPAIAAGLEFESHPVTHQKLDDALQEEASRNVEALPLLEFCLDELYKLRTESHLITWEAYEKLGGLKGAIAKRAEDVFEGMSAEAQDAFPRVIASLVTMDAVVTSHPVRLKDLDHNPHIEEVIRSFTRANLFVTDTDQAGEPFVAVAHEALINSWPRVQNWVQENQDFLRLKARIAQAAHRWRESKKENDFLLPEGKPLAEAEDVLRKSPEGLEDIEFIQSSIRFAARRRHKRQYLFASIMTFVLLAASIVLFEWLTQRQQRVARSEVDYETAVLEMRQNEIPKSLAFLADAMKNKPDNEKATALTVSAMRNFLPADKVLHPNDTEVQDAAFSTDVKQVVTASLDGTAQVWRVDTGERLATMKHGECVHTARFNWNGTNVLTASYDGAARIWDAKTGKLLHTLRQANGPRVYSAYYSQDHDSRLVVTAAEDGKVQIWDAKTGDQIGDATDPVRHGGVVWMASFNRAATLVVSASADSTARVWDAATGKPHQYRGKDVVLQHDRGVDSAAFSPNGKWIVTSSEDGTARIWNAQTGEPVGEPMHHKGPVNLAVFSPDSAYIVTASSDHTARIWKVPENGKLGNIEMIGQPMRHEGWVRSALFSPDGRFIITASYDKTARVWDARTGLPLGGPMNHSDTVYKARFASDSSTIITASSDHTAKVWKWQRPQELPVMRQPGDKTDALISAFFDGNDAHGSRLAAVSEHGVQIWDWDEKAGQAAGTPVFPQNGSDYLTGASFSSHGDWLLITTKNGAQIWKTKTGNSTGPPIKVSEIQIPELVKAVFNPVDDSLIMTVISNEVWLWEAQGNKQSWSRKLSLPVRRDGTLQGACFSPDGRLIATYSYDGLVRLWDAHTGKEMPANTPMKHSGRVYTAEFSFDGRLLVTASTDHTAIVWDTQTGKPVGNRMKHDSWVLDAGFSADGKRIVTASVDQTAQIWDAQTGMPLTKSPLRQIGEVIAAGFSPDGRWVVTVSQDGIAQVWDARTGDPMGESISGSARVVSAAFSRDSNWLLTASDDGTAQIRETPITTDVAPGWLIDAAEDLGALRLDDKGVLGPASQNDTQLRDEIRAHVSNKANDEVARFGRWLVADPATRPLSPKEEQ